jgi:hypothetical protein
MISRISAASSVAPAASFICLPSLSHGASKAPLALL